MVVDDSFWQEERKQYLLKIEEQAKIFQENQQLEEERQKFSTKIQEMEKNFQDLEKKNTMLSETLQSLRGQLVDKDKKISDLELDVVDEQTERVGLDPELIHEFKAFCDENKTNPDLSLQSLVTLEYMEYEPIKKRSYRDFQKKTGIHYSSACVYVRTMVKEFNKTKQ